MKKQAIVTLIFLIFSATAFAQNDVNGTVQDVNGAPIPGVNIVEKETTNGVSTDFDGNYAIQVADGAVLIFSYIGFNTQEITIDGKSTIDVVLTENTEALDEVVVIGYGSVKREEITSSIASVDGEELAEFKASNPAEALQGKAAGVQVISAGGNPGASPQILIRGVTTNIGSAPLIVLDGVPLPDGTSLNFLNSADIEDFQILKDASATAIYGSRASNGAVLVRTKRGKEGKAIVNVDFSYGLQNLEKIEMADSAEFIQVQNLRRTNDGQDPFYNPADFSANTDWWEEVIQETAPVTNFNISASGGNEKIKSSSSFGYFRQESNYTKGWYERISARFNLDFKLSDKITLKQDLNPRLESFERTPGNLFNILRIDPLTEVFLPENQRVGDNENQFSIYNFGTNGVSNPVGAIKRIFDETRFFALLSNTQLNYQILPELSFNSQFAFNYANQRRDIFQPEYFETGFFTRPINNVSRRTDQDFDYVWNNTFNFKKQLDEKNYINVTAGALYDYQKNNYVSAFREGIPDNDDPNLRFLDAATGERVLVNGNEAVETIFSVIGRLIYNYDNKYYLTTSFRRDASSRFPEDSRVGLFPSVSVAWDIDSEKFLENESWITDLRFKAGYGEVGNQNINRDSQFFAIGSQNYVFNGERVVTNFLSQFGNPTLKWETVKDFNLGLSGALFENSLSFSVERYQRTSEDLLFNVELPKFTGIPTLVAQNVGSFESQGWDFQIGYNKTYDDFQFGVDLTLSTNESIAKTLAPGNDQLFGQRRESLGNRFLKLTEEDNIVGAFYGLKTTGLFQNQTEINSHSAEDGTLLQPNALPGDVRFVDKNHDGLINDEDLTIIGNPFPDFFGGLNFNFVYKNFDLSMQWYGTYGNDVLNFSRTFLYSGDFDINVASGTLAKVWSPENTGAEFPRLSVLDANGNYKVPSDLFVEDGSYLRLRNIQLGYNLGINGIQKARIYVSGQNLLTFTNYSGFDPEVQSGGNIVNDFGVDFARNPISRTVLVGLNLTF